MTKPTSQQVQDFIGIASKTIAGITIFVIGWFVARWMDRMETKQDMIHEKVSTMDGDHKELDGRVRRNSQDIKENTEDIKALFQKSHTHNQTSK